MENSRKGERKSIRKNGHVSGTGTEPGEKPSKIAQLTGYGDYSKEFHNLLFENEEG